MAKHTTKTAKDKPAPKKAKRKPTGSKSVAPETTHRGASYLFNVLHGLGESSLSQYVACAAEALRDALQEHEPDELEQSVREAFDYADGEQVAIQRMSDAIYTAGWVLPNEAPRDGFIRYLLANVDRTYRLDLVPVVETDRNYDPRYQPQYRLQRHSRGVPDPKSVLRLMTARIYCNWERLELGRGKPSRNELEEAMRPFVAKAIRLTPRRLLEHILQGALAACGVSREGQPSKIVQTLTRFLRPRKVSQSARIAHR